MSAELCTELRIGEIVDAVQPIEFSHCHSGLSECVGSLGGAYTTQFTISLNNTTSSRYAVFNPNTCGEECLEMASWYAYKDMVFTSSAATYTRAEYDLHLIGEAYECICFEIFRDGVLQEGNETWYIDPLSSQDLVFQFGVIGCCETELVYLWMSNIIATLTLAFHFCDTAGEEGCDDCCCVDIPINIDICAGPNTDDGSIGWYDELAAAILGNPTLIIDGSAGGVITNTYTFTNNLPCDIQTICAELVALDGGSTLSNLTLAGVTIGTVCPTTFNLASGASTDFTVTWDTAGSNDPGNIMLQISYCNIPVADACCTDSIAHCDNDTYFTLNFEASPSLCDDCDTNTVTITPETCSGADDGIALVEVDTDCTKPLASITWTPSPASYTTNFTIGTTTGTGLTGGDTFIVDMVDDNGCTSTVTFTIPTTSAIVTTITQDDLLLCAGDTTDLAASPVGGSPPYTYSWSPSGSTTAVDPSVGAGTHTVTVTDSQGCNTATPYTLVAPAAIVVSLTGTNVSCGGAMDGSISTAVSGGTPGYTYLWSSSTYGSFSSTNANINNLAPGIYTVVVTDSAENAGCTGTNSYTVTEGTAIVIAGVIVNTACIDGSTGSITLTPSGGTAPYTYLWNDSSTASSITSQPAGTYTCAVTDANGCVENYSGTINYDTVINNIAVVTDVLCNGGSTGAIDITPSVGGASPPGSPTFTYLWDDAAASTTQDVTGLPIGTYTVVITETSGSTCVASFPYTVVESSALSVSVVNYNDNCDNGGALGDILVSWTGGTNPVAISWEQDTGGGYAPYTGTTAHITGLIAADYRATVTDANGCTATVIQTIDEPSANLSCGLSATTPTAPGAADGAVDITISGGTPPYTYNLSTGHSGTIALSGGTAHIGDLVCQYVTSGVADSCNQTGSCAVEVQCANNPPGEGCCGDRDAINYDCDCEEPCIDNTCCLYRDLLVNCDFIWNGGALVDDCITGEAELQWNVTPIFPAIITCEVADCCEESTEPWDEDVTYAAGVYVHYISEGNKYISMADANTGNVPVDEFGNYNADWWVKCCDCGQAVTTETCFGFVELKAQHADGSSWNKIYTTMPEANPDFDPSWTNIAADGSAPSGQQWTIEYPYTPDSFQQGEICFSVDVWNCRDSYTCCDICVTVCKDIKLAQKACGEWDVYDFTPAIGYSTAYPVDDYVEYNRYTVNNYDMTYKLVKDVVVGSPFTAELPRDDVYIVKIERIMKAIVGGAVATLWNNPKWIVIYELCNLIKCYKAVVLDMFCDDPSECPTTCGSEVETAKRYHANKLVSLWSALIAYIQKDRLSSIGINYVDTDRQLLIRKIGRIMSILNAVSSECKPCTSDGQIKLSNFTYVDSTIYPTTSGGGTVGTGGPDPSVDDGGDSSFNPKCCE